MSYTLTVTVGGNYAGTAEPMPDLEFETFIDEVAEQLTTLATKRQLEATTQHQPDAFFLETHVGMGEWEGIEERSAKVTIVSEFKVTGVSLILPELHSISAAHRQAAFALTVGESILYER